MKQLLSILACSVLFSACGSADTEETSTDTSAVEEMAVTTDEYTDEEIREYGLVKEVEDTGYPMFAIDMEFPERNMTTSFSLNIEAGGFDHDAVYNMKGKYATIYYTSELMPSLADMQVKGNSVFGKYAPENIDPEWQKITGTLSGAHEPSQGDLPGTVTVTGKDGNQVNFKYYIDDAMVAANGKEVTAYYLMSGRNNITRIELSAE